MNKSNLANGLLQGSLDTTSTTVNLQSGYGNIMPAVPFYITVTPFGQLSTMGNSEIMQVTARTGDTLTVVRGQRGTTAKSFINGDVISNGIYTEDIDEKATKLSIPNGTVPYRQGVGSGEPDSSMLISDDATAGTLALYGADGTMTVSSPTDDAHAATKKYVDDSLNGLTKVAQTIAPIWFGITSNLIRVGNLVILNFDGNATSTIEAWKNISSVEKLPTGYRPTDHAHAFGWVEGAVSNLDIYHDGHMEMYTRGSGTYLKGYAVYPTADSWPN